MERRWRRIRSEPCEENCSLVNFDLALRREQGRYWQRSLDLNVFLLRVSRPWSPLLSRYRYLNVRIKKLTSTILLQTRSSSSSKRFSRNDRRFSIRDLDLGRRLSARSFCRCFYERILRAVSFSGNPFLSQSRVWSGPMERAVFSALLYFYTRARFHYVRWIFDLFVENIKNTGNCPNQRKKRIAIDSNVQHVLE